MAEDALPDSLPPGLKSRPMRPRKWTIPFLLLALVVFTVPPAAQGGRGQVRPVVELLREVRSKRDDVPDRVLWELGSHRSAEALEALKTTVTLLRTPTKLARAYSCCRYFKDVDGLHAPALEFLRTDALETSRSPARVAATGALASFGEEGLVIAEGILFRTKDGNVKAAGARVVLPLLAKRVGAELLIAVLDHLPPSEYPTLRTYLRSLPLSLEARRAVFLPRILSNKTPEALRLALLDRLANDKSEEVAGALVTLVERSTPTLQQHALELLLAMGEERRVQKPLFKLIRSRYPDLRLVAIRALGRIAIDDPRWIKQLEALAKSRDTTDRVGAVYALVQLRTVEAVDRLYSLLDDEDWRVRAVAMQGVVALRRPDSLPLLIAQLDIEEGRMRADVLTALELLTGLNLGRNVERWKTWWTAEGETFELPTRNEVRKRQAERELRKSSEQSVATFYGLPVVSNRATFVVDCSGSMREPAHMNERTTSDEDGPTRFMVAVDQLRTLFKRIPDGHRTNLVFFETRVHPWSRKLRMLDDDIRADAFDFISGMQANGGTNVYDALTLAFEDELVDTIYVLSDGAPTAGRLINPDDIREEIQRLNRRRQIVIHCVSVGQSSRLLRSLAADSDGRYVEVGLLPRPRREKMVTE